MVISSEHAGLKPRFKDLEDEIYRVLASVDDPHQVSGYIQSLRAKSIEWLRLYENRYAKD